MSKPKEFDSRVEHDKGEFVVENHKKRPDDVLRLKFDDYASGADMKRAIDKWANE